TLSAIAAGEASSRDGRDIVMELRPGGFECNQFFWA
ncbi:MAG: hypothetical protein QOI98_2835, partial [Solirubrobacteraceae bacterium]|nr:hypothetical protein [Solirubrobacteraceae bacterium]